MYGQNPTHNKNSSHVLLITYILGFCYLFLHFGDPSFSTQYALALTTNSKNFLTYENPVYGFKIEYPQNWEKIEFSGDIEEGNRRIIVNFISPLEGLSDTFREYFIIEIGALDSHATTMSFQNSINMYITSLKSLPNFKLAESTVFSFAGNPAQRLVYSYNNPEVGVTKRMDILINKNEKLFLLSFNSDANKYNRYLPMVQEMVDSLQFR